MSEIKQPTVLTFNGHDHYLNAILNMRSSIPRINVEATDIDFVSAAPSMQPEPEAGIITDIIFYKFNGKFTVLVGHALAVAQLEKLKGTTIKGYLLSTPALKATRVPAKTALIGSITATPRNYDAEFSNRPRIVYDKQHSNAASTDRPKQGLYRKTRIA